MIRAAPVLFLLAVLAGGCTREAPAPPAGVSAETRQAMQEHTETLLLIHYRLDSASTELADAEAQSAAGNHSGADYHVTQARRHLEAADDAVLQLGLELQQRFNLDAAGE